MKERCLTNSGQGNSDRKSDQPVMSRRDFLKNFAVGVGIFALPVLTGLACDFSSDSRDGDVESDYQEFQQKMKDSVSDESDKPGEHKPVEDEPGHDSSLWDN